MTQHSGGNFDTQFDPWLDSYAARSAGLSASEVRALFAVASRPEVVSLAGGMPFVSALPNETIQSAINTVMTTRSAEALQYGSGDGYPILRQQITEIMREEGIDAQEDDVVVTTGSQMGLDLVTRLFINPGDVILAEAPSYVGAIGVFRSYQAEVVHVPMDQDGLVPEELEATIAKLDSQGKTIKFLYTIPNFHNPAGVTLSAERRPKILEIAKRHHILVIEDNPYGLLWFNEAPPKAIRSLDDEGVIYLGSFSKTLAPGFRVGWVVAPHAIRQKLVLENEAAVLSPTSFGQMVVSEYLSNIDWRAQIDVFRGHYRERCAAMLSALSDELPELSWTVPNGGFYVWLTMPEGMNSKDMLPIAVKELVAYTPGTAFYADGTGADHIRLSFCYPTPENIRVGIKRLATVIAAEADLLETFGPSVRIDPKKQKHISSPPPNLT